MIIDTHAHLSLTDPNLETIIESFKSNIIVISGTNAFTNKEVLHLCEKYKNVYGTLGIHPTEVVEASEDDLFFIEKNITNNKIIGIGEIGIDLYWSKDNLEEQEVFFKKQLDLARKYNKTVVIHTRNSKEEVYDSIGDYSDVKMIFHCYDGDYEYYLKLKQKFNAKFGIGGVVTFKNAKELKEFVLMADINDLVLETDSPYLAPEPYRGKTNEPKNVFIIAKKIAEIKEKDESFVTSITTKNALSQFDLNI